nr:Ger(x)C family spore germination protein [Alicyclobacillus sp. SO9]
MWITLISGLACVFLTTGCWDMKELNDRAIVISSAIDTTDDGHILLTDQFANPSALGHNVESPNERFYSMSSKGDTVLQAAQLLQLRLSRNIFVGHRRNIFIGQQTAKNGLNEIIDEFTRSPDSRIRTDMSIVQGANAGNVLKIPSVVEKLPSIAALKSRSVVGGGPPGTTYVEFLRAAASKTTCPTLPLVKIESHPSDYMADAGSHQLRFAGRAVFDKKLRMVGQIDYTETVYRFWEVGHLTHQTFAVKIPNTGQSMSVYTNHLKSKLKVRLKKRHLDVAVFLYGDGRITENNTSLSLQKQSNIDKVQTALEQQIQSGLLQLIQRVQQDYHTDIFRFDRTCQKNYPLEWSKVTDQWPEIFSHATVHVYAHIPIKTIGEMGTALHQHVQM